MSRNGIRSPLRKTLLPTADLMGDFLIGEYVIQEVFEVLRRQCREGPDANGNEGLVFLGGWKSDLAVFYSTVVVPQVKNTWGSVFVDASEFGRCARKARNANLQILAQVHSHPGNCCHHSDGDDRLIVLPYEGMLSIVVPEYAARNAPLEQWGIHQYQQGTWCLCAVGSVRHHFSIVPSSLRAL